MDLLHPQQYIAKKLLALKVNLIVGSDMLTAPRVVVRKRIRVSWLVDRCGIASDGLLKLCSWRFVHCAEPASRGIGATRFWDASKVNAFKLKTRSQI